MREAALYGRFDKGIWQLLAHDISRHHLREALIARYFPEDRDQLATLAAASRRVAAAVILREEPPARRKAAFRQTILEIYDYRCAACGVRVILDQRISLVEAAHLIPFDGTTGPQTAWPCARTITGQWTGI